MTKSINLQIKLPEFASRVGWRLDTRQLNDVRFDMIISNISKERENRQRRETIKKINTLKAQKQSPLTRFMGYFDSGETSVDVETKKLMQVKKLLDAYPMEMSEE